MVCMEEAWKQGVPPEQVGCWGGSEQKQSHIPKDSEFMRREALMGI